MRIYRVVVTTLLVTVLTLLVLPLSSQETSPEEANEALILVYAEAETERDYDRLGDLLAEDFVRHGTSPVGVEITSREAFKAYLEETAAIFPDYVNAIQMIVADDEMVAAYVHFSGTFAGNGTLVEFPFIAFWRIDDGRIAEMWVEWNDLLVSQQMGLLPMEEELMVPSAVTATSIEGTWDWQYGPLYFQYSADQAFRAYWGSGNLSSDIPGDLGTYAIDNGVLTMVSNDSTLYCDAGDVGTYAIHLGQDGLLELVLQSDACLMRRAPSTNPQPFNRLDGTP